ncbi:MAG: rhomboid family intramembrane serine protease [SAR324 cluster bacterium]|nr:rhomboid family intramembrane serine protease [SAR324 cluster bacterium]
MRIRFDSPVTILFSILLLFVFVITHQEFSPEFIASIPPQLLPFLQEDFYLVKPWIDYRNPLDYLTVFTHILGHADWPHLFGNLSLLLLLGGKVEEKYKSVNLIKWIFVTACVTGLLNVLLLPTTLRGASGIVFMLIILFSMTEMRKGVLPITTIFVFLLYLGQEVYFGINTTGNVSRFCHITGGVMGAYFGYRYYVAQLRRKPSLLSRLSTT